MNTINFTQEELDDYSRLETPEAKRLFWQAYFKRDFRAFVSLLGYKDMGAFHTKQLELISKFRFLESQPVRRLWLWSRGFFKTSLLTEAHTIWIIVNNPDVRILIVSYSLEVAKKPLQAIRNHFTSNNDFRYFFREFCPKPNKEGKIEWGTTEAITVPNRVKNLKEPTVMCAGVGTNITGLHYDCLLPDTEILTSNGWKKVKDIEVGNRVLTLKGTFKNITHKIKKESYKQIVSIKPCCFSDTSKFTEDHKIYVFDGTQFKWIEAKDIKHTDFLVIPKLRSKNGSLSRVNKRINELLRKRDIWRLIGYWLAEGAATDGNGIRLTFSIKEINYIEDVRRIVKDFLGKDITVTDTASNTSVVFFTDADFKTILNTLGTHSYNKHLPPFFLNNNSVRQKELVLGYFRGDGCFVNDGVYFVGVSKDLLTGIQLLFAKWGIHSYLRKDTDGGEANVCGVKCNTRPKYSLRSTSPLASILLGGITHFPYRENTFFTDKYWLVPIDTFQIGGIAKEVYDITVNEEHNFFCQGIIAHNCIKADDLVNKDSVTNDTQIQSSKDYYSLLRPLFDNPTIPREDVIGTIYHFNDLHSELKENKEFEKSIIPAFDENGFAFPERLDEKGWQSLSSDPSINPYDLQRQWLLRPVNPKDSKFKEEWIKYYDSLPDSAAEYILVDPASTQKKKSDYTVLERWGVDYDGNCYLIEAFRDRFTAYQRIDRLFEMVKRAKNLRWVKYEVLGGRHGDLEMIAKKKMEEKIDFFVKETKATTASKADRIEQRLAGPYHAGIIYWPRSLIARSEFDGKIYDFVQELRLEYLQFPFTEHDDILDCHSQLFEEQLIRGNKTVVKEKKPMTYNDLDRYYANIEKMKGANPFLTNEEIRERLFKNRVKRIMVRT